MAIIDYEESAPAVAAGTETTVLTYVVPAGTTLYLSGFSATGPALGRFRLYIAGTPRAGYRTSHADRNAVLSFPTDEPVPPGTEILIRVDHDGLGSVGPFEASLYGTLR